MNDELLRYLESLSGVRAVCRVDRSIIDDVVELEKQYEQAAFLPMQNQGVRSCLQRETIVALLKDAHFRPPPEPTLYLVEELPPGAEVEHELVVEGKRYGVLGEEMLPHRGRAGEESLMVSSTFAIYPARRREAARPSFFLLPPVSFPELEAESDRLGIQEIVSSSPCSAADTRLRRSCGFSENPELATLLLGFNGEGAQG